MSRGDEAELGHFCTGRVQLESRALLLQLINTSSRHHVPQSRMIKPSFNTSTKRLLSQTLSSALKSLTFLPTISLPVSALLRQAQHPLLMQHTLVDVIYVHALSDAVVGPKPTHKRSQKTLEGLIEHSELARYATDSSEHYTRRSG